MKRSFVDLASALTMLVPAVGLLLGLDIGLIYPIWIAGAGIIVVLSLAVWYRRGYSFKPFVPLTFVVIGALVLVGVWLYLAA
jgi:hypothetical protein